MRVAKVWAEKEVKNELESILVGSVQFSDWRQKLSDDHNVSNMNIESGPIVTSCLTADIAYLIMSVLVFLDTRWRQTLDTLALLMSQSLLFAGRLFHTVHAHT